MAAITFNEQDVENQGTVTIEVHSWDYVFALVYGIVLLISLVGVAKYAIRAQVLTIAIMVTNVFSIGCKYSHFGPIILIYLQIERCYSWCSLVRMETKLSQTRDAHFTTFSLRLHTTASQ